MISIDPKRVPLPPRPVLIALAILPALLAIGIFVFIARFQLAHDEATCPFREVETRALSATLEVREDARRCIPEIEEHRWTVLREGAEPRELGRFPLESEQIERGFPWVASIDEGRAVVTVTNEGRGELVFREPSADGVASAPSDRAAGDEAP